ncbi:hypothetical protein J1N35_038095 [Gossypium stocksii]|uniref:Uncharacterized protein n=1 Tax=Gossypium stocksii TaxID=47602 RepID=A0A9D3ZLJ6_9ROSI|nr:hypothetical protein J1N35_038095 [Gossypium stocksii]
MICLTYLMLKKMEKSINVGKIILKQIYDCAKKKTGSAYFPSLITSLYLRARVKTQANLKGQYVQGCITSHDLERLVEKVHELNQGEQEEPTEPKTKESKNATETEANSVIEIEEEESDRESNSPKPIEESSDPKPRVGPEEEPVKPSVEPEFTTPMSTSASTPKKLELLVIMDMCKFMHKQQKTYWKYTKIRGDSIQNTFKNISNTFVLEFPDAIFDTWTEETDDKSGDGA